MKSSDVVDKLDRTQEKDAMGNSYFDERLQMSRTQRIMEIVTIGALGFAMAALTAFMFTMFFVTPLVPLVLAFGYFLTVGIVTAGGAVLGALSGLVYELAYIEPQLTDYQKELENSLSADYEKELENSLSADYEKELEKSLSAEHRAANATTPLNRPSQESVGATTKPPTDANPSSPGKPAAFFTPAPDASVTPSKAAPTFDQAKP